MSAWTIASGPSSAHFDQEPAAAARSGDAPDEEDKQWYFGMKAHVGVDSKTKIIHTAVATAANVADSAVLPDLLHGEETRMWGDHAYRGQSQVIRECALQAKTAPIGVTATKIVSTKWSGRRTGPSRRAVEGRACVCGDEAEVRICEATLSRTEEECHPTVRGVRAGESILGAEKTVIALDEMISLVDCPSAFAAAA